MRQAANALLAVPIFVAATFGALLRRSFGVRVGVVFSLAVLLGYGALSAGRPEPIAATAATPILPLTEGTYHILFFLPWFPEASISPSSPGVLPEWNCCSSIARMTIGPRG